MAQNLYPTLAQKRMQYLIRITWQHDEEIRKLCSPNTYSENNLVAEYCQLKQQKDSHYKRQARKSGQQKSRTSGIHHQLFSNQKRPYTLEPVAQNEQIMTTTLMTRKMPHESAHIVGVV
jgi:hypothetical protein